MMTITGVDNVPYMRKSLVSLAGLSTDTKPVGKIENHTIANGSMLIEIDTKKIFMYDETNKAWREM